MNRLARARERWLLAPYLVGAALVTGCGGGATTASANSSAPPGPVTIYRNTLPGLTAAAPIDLIQTTIYFSAGAASVVHTHTSPNLATVLHGQVTVNTLTGDKHASSGEALVEPLNQPVQAQNTGSADAMVVAAFCVPHGAKPTSPVVGRPAPAVANKTLSTFSLESQTVTGRYGLIQLVLDFAPGSRTARQRDGGPGVVTVIQGRVAVSRNGSETTYSVGESFSEMPGETLQTFNRGSGELILAASYLVPDGAQLTTNP